MVNLSISVVQTLTCCWGASPGRSLPADDSATQSEAVVVRRSGPYTYTSPSSHSKPWVMYASSYTTTTLSLLHITSITVGRGRHHHYYIQLQITMSITVGRG